ncbi:unnamed protein product [Arabis nemorensis]|uniref:Cyclin-dependent kinase inhibitor domain-containing protein n=1 Tax=Arabis nemorensis TaxID=586526 RepID=A0A565BV05_9BRAS|nr:unnamed protein product [Arabis nemorensis]
MAAGEKGVRGRRRERDVTDQGTTTTVETPTVKRRKMMEEEVESRIVLSPQATNRGGIIATRNSAGVVIVRRRGEEQCQIPLSSDLDSYCSGNIHNNRSEEKSKRRIEFVDFQENYNGGGGDDEIETSWIYDNFNKRKNPYSEQEESVNYMDSKAMENRSSEDTVVESRRRLKKSGETTTVKEGEIEDFFQTAEKDLRNKMLECSRKYNFDFEKDEPLGGRYEWVKLNP